MRRLFSTIRQSFRISLQNIIINKLRSFLTMLGIIIGVAAVIALITLVENVMSSIMGQFSSLGAGTLSVAAMGNQVRQGLSDAELDVLRKIDGVEGISPSVSTAGTAVVNGESFTRVTVQGASEDYFRHNPDAAQAGRGLQPTDMAGDVFVCLVDMTFVRKALRGREVIGSSLMLNGYAYRVVGIQKSETSIMNNADNSDSDGTITVPYRNVLSMMGSRNVSSLTVYVSGASTTEVEADIREELRRYFNNADNAFSIFNVDSLMSVMSSVSSMFSVMLGGIASIALLVGGIGIMNMMLVSVSERTREIGLRKALGAEPVRIQLQFLLESVFLSVFGGILGVLLGIFIAYAGTVVMGIMSETEVTFTISWGAVAIGIGFSMAIGIIFGWAPARRASRLNPIDALRAE